MKTEEGRKKKNLQEEEVRKEYFVFGRKASRSRQGRRQVNVADIDLLADLSLPVHDWEPVRARADELWRSTLSQ